MIEILIPCRSCGGSGKWGPTNTLTPGWARPSGEMDCPGCRGSGKVRDHRAERLARHVASGGCPATIHHGPGRQSDTFCERPAGHEQVGFSHRVTVQIWEWDGNEAYVDDWGEVQTR